MSRAVSIAAVLVAAAAGLAVAVWWGGAADAPPGAPGAVPAPTRPRPEAGAARASSVPEPVAYAPGVGVRSGGAVEIQAASLAAGEPVIVNLLTPEPSLSGPRPVRIIAPDRRVLEIEGRLLAEDGRSATIEVDPNWLGEGRHIVELKTTERTHFPLRRYVLEVK